MKNFSRIICYVIILVFVPSFVFAQTPPGVNIPLSYILELAQGLAGFLIVAGGVLVAVTIIGTGMMYLMAGGSSQKMAGAKSMFKAGIIGGLIIFAPGMIINTVSSFGSNPFGFFGGGGGTTGTGTGGGGGGTPTPDPTVTYGCSAGNACIQVAGGIFADATCAGQCGGAGAQSTSSACFTCVGQGNAYCLADANCYPNELSCNGVFTRDAAGCP